jgi:acyl transferase domain-containing protein
VEPLRGQTHRLPVSHAFHSALMEPVLEQFAAEVARTRLAAPTIAIVSNVTGEWLKAEEATDPTYWVRHLRGTVRFGAGLRQLTADAKQALVEVGPGAALTRLSRGASVPEARAIATQPSDETDGHVAFLRALGRLWVIGAPVDREAAAGGTHRRSSLPGYPFERVRLWIEPGPGKGLAAPATAAPAPSAPAKRGSGNTATVIAEIWREVLGVDASDSDDFLTLGGDSLIAVRIAARLRERLGREVKPGDLFAGGTITGLAHLIDAVEARGIGVAEGVREEGWL